MPEALPLPEAIHIRLNTGDLVDLLHPELTTFHMARVALSLSKLCRFGGQPEKKQFYSVAEHSVYVSLLAERLGGDPWSGLWHDAAEGVGMADLVTPLKAMFPGYTAIEDSVLAELARQFHFTFPFDPMVLLADKLMVDVEGSALLPGWQRGILPAHEGVVAGLGVACLEPDLAYQLFIQRLQVVAKDRKPLLKLELAGA